MKKMKTTMKKTTINFFVAVIFLLGANIVYADDWLDLVRKYTSADEINFAPDKWESLVNDHSGVENKNILAQWWDTFNDRTLTQLIEMAFMRNRDMQSSRARVEEARAQLSVTMSSRSPKVNGSGSWTHTEPSKNSMAGGVYDSYHLGFDASWELDLWAKNRTPSMLQNLHMKPSMPRSIIHGSVYRPKLPEITLTLEPFRKE